VTSVAFNGELKRGLASTNVASHWLLGHWLTGPYLLATKSRSVLPSAAPKSMKTHFGTVRALGTHVPETPRSHWHGIAELFTACNAVALLATPRKLLVSSFAWSFLGLLAATETKRQETVRMAREKAMESFILTRLLENEIVYLR